MKYVTNIPGIGTFVSKDTEKSFEQLMRERYEDHVIRTMAGCWGWNGNKYSNGYPLISVHKKRMLAHRVSYRLFNGTIPDGKVVLHKCDNPGCTNPLHLLLGTQADNLRDMRNKHRHQHGESHKRAKLNNLQVREIIRLYNFGRLNMTIIAKRFGVCIQTISNIVNRRCWQHIELEELL